MILASGAHATYDEDKPAAVISSEIEQALARDGVPAVAASAVRFV